MRISDKKYYEHYLKLVGNQIDDLLASFDCTAQSTEPEFQIHSAAVYSCNLEGNSVDFNSFMDYLSDPDKTKPYKDIQEIEDLLEAYRFAQTHSLTERHLLKCHKILSKAFLPPNKQGEYRTERGGVFGNSGTAYSAIEPELLNDKMKQFFEDLSDLLGKDLSSSAVFYHTSLIHLEFAQIHPFRDGNGRTARILEKWFLAEKLGDYIWELPSEKYYREHQTEYNANLHLGTNYYELNYDKCFKFLLMLPKALGM